MFEPFIQAAGAAGVNNNDDNGLTFWSAREREWL